MNDNKSYEISYLIESTLQILKIAQTQKNAYIQKGELSLAQDIQNKIINNYENIYLSLYSLSPEEQKQHNFNQLRKNINKMLNFYKIEENFIKKEIENRNRYKNNSGAEVIKNLFIYQRKKIISTKRKLMTLANEILNKEENLHVKISNAIQEEEQIKLSKRLPQLWREFKTIEIKINNIQSKLDEIENKINKKWEYEIYGTLSSRKMKKIYENIK